MRAVLYALLALLCGCLDFDQAREDCLAKGNCLGTLAPVTLVSSSPENQAQDVAVNSVLGATFSREMDTGSVKVVIAPSVPLGGLQWEPGDSSFTVQPAAALAYSTQYAVSLSGRSKDGVALGDDATFSFTTGIEPDRIPPTLSATSPQAGAQNVPVTFKLVLTFSEALADGTLQVSLQPTFSLGEPTWSGDQRTATFAAPSGPFSPSTDYVVQVDAKDLAGNALTGLKTFAFRTAAPADNTAPTVVGASPAADAAGVSVFASPSVTFSEPMNAATVSTSFQLTPAVPGGCSILPDATGTLFTCQHGQPLQGNTRYTLTVGTGARDGAGNALAQAFTFSFTTGAVPDTTAPTIVATTPLHNSNGAPQRPTLTVTFSEPMDPGSTQAALSILQPAGAPSGGTFVWNQAGTEVSYTLPPGYSFPYGQAVLWQVGGGAKDLAGNALGSQTFTFQVRRLATVDLFADATGGFNDGWVDSIFLTNVHSVELRVGDDAANRETRAVVSFNLAQPALPATALDVTAATLTLRQTNVSGTPYTPHIQNAFVYTYVFGIQMTSGLGQDEFEAAPICLGNPLACQTAVSCRGLPLTTSGTSGDFAVNVTKVVDLGLKSTAKRASFRVDRRHGGGLVVGCPEIKETDNSPDYAIFASAESANNKPKLSVTYTYP